MIASCRCTTIVTVEVVVFSDAREDLYFLLTLIFLDLYLVCRSTYWYMCFQDSSYPDNCGFTRWVDPPPIYPHQQYITYLQRRIFDLEYGPGSGNSDKSKDDNINDAEEPLCNNPYCQYPYHKKHGPPSPPPPPSMGGYYGEDATHFDM
jgi:hypothetical protein